MNWFDTVLIVVICFLILTDLTKVLLEFCVIEVFKFWVRYRYEENKEWKYPKLGDSQGTQGNIQVQPRA